MRDLWVPLSGAIAQQKRVETIANNVANANTAGFRRDDIAFKEYLVALEEGHYDIDLPNKEWAPADFYRSYGAEHAMVKIDGVYTDHTQGQLSPTNNHFDFALHGPGFFEVLTPSGVRYTRQGNFTLNAEGQLVTTDGHLVLSRPQHQATLDDQAQDPRERIINVGNNVPTINLRGEIYVNGQMQGQLAVAEFHDKHALKKQGHSLFINPHPDNKKQFDQLNSPKTAIHQGFIESSNVNAVREMSDLINAHRSFEAIQRVIKTYDDISSKGVNEISRF